VRCGSFHFFLDQGLDFALGLRRVSCDGRFGSLDMRFQSRLFRLVL